MYFRLFAWLVVPPILTCFLAALPAYAQDTAALWQQENDAATSFPQAVDLGADMPEMSPADMKVILGNYASFPRARNRLKEAETMETRAAALP